MAHKEKVNYLEDMSKQIRRNIVEMVGPDKKGHIGGSCSVAEIVSVLYFEEMKLQPENPNWEGRDRFLFSKGHAALAQYAALAELGYFSKQEFKRLKTLGGLLQGHPETRTPGVEANTGSLGQGLSIACGMAASMKIDNKSNRVFCVMGDGEQAEGQLWEAAMAASNFSLDNLYAFIDKNRIQATGFIDERYKTDPLSDKWKAFGWYVQEVDGHNVEELMEALQDAKKVSGQPKLIIANTIKGKGISFAENKAAYHNGLMTRENYEQALKELA